MLANFLGNVAAGGIRNLARNLFPGFWERGISANKALQELRDLGLGYRRQDFLADFRQGKSAYEQATRIRFVNTDKTPSQGILESKYHGVPDRYSFVFKATGFDSTTGEESERYFFMHRNSLDTRGNMEQDAAGWLGEQSQQYGFDVDSVSIREGYVNPVWELGD